MAGKSTERDLDERLMRYSADVIRFCMKLSKYFPRKINEQLMSCSTSVGANYQEAQGAESKADFIHKLQISLKEMRESYYWLKVVYHSGIQGAVPIDDLLIEAKQLRAILSKCVATAKGKNK